MKCVINFIQRFSLLHIIFGVSGSIGEIVLPLDIGTSKKGSTTYSQLPA